MSLGVETPNPDNVCERIPLTSVNYAANGFGTHETLSIYRFFGYREQV